MKEENPNLNSMQSKNPKAILWPFSSNTPGQAGTHLQLSKLRPSLLHHPRVCLERRFGALLSLNKRLSSHPVIEYQKEAAPMITGPDVVVRMVLSRRSPIQLPILAHVA